MTIAVGLVLGIGLVLVISPLLWPSRDEAARTDGRIARAVRDRLVHAGLGTTPLPVIVVASIGIALAVAATVFALVPVTAIALAAGAAALATPVVVISWRASSHQRATRVVWPDVVDHLVSAVRAGIALPESVVSLAHTGPPLTRAAFAEFEREYRITGSFGESLDGLKARLADPTADRILETLRLSRDVGGTELTGVLRSLSTYLRADAAVRSELEARQSWLVNAAKLGVAAPWIVLLLLATRPEAAAAYNTPAGTTLIVIGLGVTVVAYRVMIQLGRLPQERRWFG